MIDVIGKRDDVSLEEEEDEEEDEEDDEDDDDEDDEDDDEDEDDEDDDEDDDDDDDDVVVEKGMEEELVRKTLELGNTLVVAGCVEDESDVVTTSSDVEVGEELGVVCTEEVPGLEDDARPELWLVVVELELELELELVPIAELVPVEVAEELEAGLSVELGESIGMLLAVPEPR